MNDRTHSIAATDLYIDAQGWSQPMLTFWDNLIVTSDQLRFTRQEQPRAGRCRSDCSHLHILRSAGLECWLRKSTAQNRRATGTGICVAGGLSALHVGSRTIRQATANANLTAPSGGLALPQLVACLYSCHGANYITDVLRSAIGSGGKRCDTLLLLVVSSQ